MWICIDVVDAYTAFIMDWLHLHDLIGELFPSILNSLNAFVVSASAVSTGLVPEQTRHQVIMDSMYRSNVIVLTALYRSETIFS